MSDVRMESGVTSKSRTSNRHDISLDLDCLLNCAYAETGLGEFEDDDLPKRLGLIIDAYKNEKLSAAEQIVSAETILDIIVTRLNLIGDRKRHPEIENERIENPLVVGGFGRSGTTLLYSLLAADPAARSPHWWDTLHPSPPPGLSPEHDSLRRQLAHREVMEFLQVVPIKPAHNFFVNGADMILECYMLWGLDFRSLAPFLYFRAPAQPVLDPGAATLNPLLSMVDTYKFEKKLLQNLQWRRPTGHWVLKDPTHHFYLPELFEVFPDATVVWPHRDPVNVFASMVELCCLMTGGAARREIDRPEMANALVKIFRDGLNRVINHPIIDSPRVIHVLYRELTQDSISLARKIYERMGRKFTEQIADNIRTYNANPNNKADLYGKFQYRLENTGFTAEQLRHEFRNYIEHFDIPPG